MANQLVLLSARKTIQLLGGISQSSLRDLSPGLFHLYIARRGEAPAIKCYVEAYITAYRSYLMALSKATNLKSAAEFAGTDQAQVLIQQARALVAARVKQPFSASQLQAFLGVDQQLVRQWQQAGLLRLTNAEPPTFNGQNVQAMLHWNIPRAVR